jgi:hypothetical protein
MKRLLTGSAFLAAVCALTFLASPALAGPVGGTQRGFGRVEARDSVEYRVECWGGQSTSVYVIGDGDTDLDLFIFDSSGTLLDSDTDLTDRCLGEFFAWRRAMFTIRIVNLGNVYNEYMIVVE